MAAEPGVDEAVERAMRTQEARIESIRTLAKGRQSLADVKADAAQKMAALERENAERINAAERDDARLYSAATKAGWTTDELRKIGFDEPEKQRRVARRTTRHGQRERRGSVAFGRHRGTTTRPSGGLIARGSRALPALGPWPTEDLVLD